MALIAPSAAYRIDDYAEAARRLGAELAVATEAHHSLAEEMGASLIPIDFDDPDEAALRIAAARPTPQAVAALDDRGVMIAARAAAGRRAWSPPPPFGFSIPTKTRPPPRKKRCERRGPGDESNRRRCLSQLRLGW